MHSRTGSELPGPRCQNTLGSFPMVFAELGFPVAIAVEVGGHPR